MKTGSLGILLVLLFAGCNKSTPVGSTSYQYHKPTEFHKTAAQGIKPPADQKIYNDPDADFKQRRGQIHNRTYLKKELAPLHLNVDSLQNVVDQLNRNTRDNEWEYQVSTMQNSTGKILRFYKSHNNPDGSSGRTMYGDEKRRLPER